MFHLLHHLLPLFFFFLEIKFRNTYENFSFSISIGVIFIVYKIVCVYVYTYLTELCGKD